MWRTSHVNVDITNNNNGGSGNNAHGSAGGGGGGMQRSTSTNFSNYQQQQHPQQHHLHPQHTHYIDGATAIGGAATPKQMSQLQRDRFASSQAILQDAITESKISLHVNYRNSNSHSNGLNNNNNNSSNNIAAQQQQQQRPRPISMYEQYRSPRPYSVNLDSPQPPLTPPPAPGGRSESFFFGESNTQNVTALRQQHQQHQFRHKNKMPQQQQHYLKQMQAPQRAASPITTISSALTASAVSGKSQIPRAHLRQSPSELV
ncbi:probable serine/threonine-protein kinase DDB_G0277165 [Eurosta solidaginis]|uniref:probable serine/threonine-protein kinase DDB_G0277165 n=1 Tax=Eurosta solidaginis TaxID=178769 RepID=UPI0035312B36